MDIQRVALIYDNRHRPETTGTYCLRALKELVHVTHFLPDQVEQIPKGGFDLYLNIDDGLCYRLPPALRPAAWWVIDTHLHPGWAAEKGRDFDWLFAAQRDGAERLRELDLPAQWLPLACDPLIHKPHPVAKQWDVCFVGWVYEGPRQELISIVQRHFPNSFIGQKYFDEYANKCSGSRIGFNRSVRNDINMRVFETAACGTLLVTNDLQDNGQEELFTSDKHVVTYEGADELLDKLRFYVGHDEAREQIAQAGYCEAISRHTYRHRMQSLLQAIRSSDSNGRPSTVATGQPNDGRHEAAKVSLPPAAGPRSSIHEMEVGFENSNGHVRPDSDGDGSGTSDHDNRSANPGLEDVDVIIKTFLRPKALRRLLNSIREFYPQVHVTIADDGNLRESTDADSRACCQLIDAVENFTLHSLPFAAGVTPGRNLLVEQTHRPYVLLLDDDFCVTAETRIESFLKRLQSDPQLGVVAGTCIDVVGDERRPRNSGGTLRIDGETMFIDSSGWNDRKNELRDYVPHFALIRREVFRDVRWDGALGAEHYDFCLQLQKSRWKVAQDLAVQVDHYHFSDALPGYAERRFDYADAQQWLLKKWNLRRIVQDGRVVVELEDAKGTQPGIDGTAECEKDGSTHRTSASDFAARRLADKDSLYFDLPRPEVVDLIPTTARRVLDIGCGAGALGELLKQRQSAEVVGIELQLEAAAIASTRLDWVLVQSIEDPTVEFAAGSFDCIVCADVLEHLRDPEVVLERIRGWLAEGGTLVASIPNVRHHSVVTSLLEGNWTYEAAGLLDGDHVRFFTRREIEKLLDRLDFEIVTMRVVPGPGDDVLRGAAGPGTVCVGSLNVAGLAPETADEFFAYQYLVVARPMSRPERKVTSIVIVTHNQCAYTKECVDSIRLRTVEPYELIFVDNGSTDKTVQYLRGLAHASSSFGGAASPTEFRGCQSVRLIENTENRGYPAAANQGLKGARGDYVVLLNNDTVVTSGWLKRMLDVLDSSGQIGMVGPCSNRVSGSQMVPVPYENLASLDGFAWDWGKKHRQVVEETDRLVGFCLAMKRKVIEQIGLLDERFGIGCFEDDDLCLRALQAGWRAVIARAAFVHHYGSQTFQGSGIDLGAVLNVNCEKFLEKWAPAFPSPVTRQPPTAEPAGQPANSLGRSFCAPSAVGLSARTARHAPASPKSDSELGESDTSTSRRHFHLVNSPTGGLLLRPVQIQISLCMIVRDNETTIGPALESIRPWVDEIIVVDTGSKDNTREICRQYGAELHEFPWCDDFSAARNESLKHARGEWIFWMDSDDTISIECGQRLRALADGPHAEQVLGYVMQVHCPGSGEDGDLNVTAVDHVKLIRNRSDLRFEGRIHEQLLPAIRRANGEVALTDIYVRHSGSDHSPAGWQRKLDRDLRILNRELGDAPNHPFVLFNLGMTYADAKRFDEAIGYLERCLAVSNPDESHLRKAYALLVSTLGQAGRHDEAWQRCQAGQGLYPDDKELLFRSAILHHHFGRLVEAEADYLRVLNDHEDRHFTSIDQGLDGFKARHNLAIVYEDMGSCDKAEEQWRRIVAEVPTYHLGWRGLAEILLRQGKLDELQDLSERMPRAGGLLEREARILHGKLAAARGDLTTAVDQLRSADDPSSDDREPLRALCRILFEQGEPAAAEAALSELALRQPDDPATLHNLGTLRLRRQQFLEAESALRNSLRLRPRSAPTLLQLGYALDGRGARAEAAEVWKESLRIDPANVAARTALAQSGATAV